MELIMQAPGYKQHPNHRIAEQHIAGKVAVEFGGHVLADSSDTIRVDEDRHPARFYFSRSAVDMSKLEPSTTTTHCPFKGTARYFNIKLDGKTLQDAVWSYEEPYDEHVHLKGRLAFYDDKYRDIHVRAIG
jgi:uncharacterized protein (DUF427 family)